MFIATTLDISVAQYIPFAFFNWMMPLAALIFAAVGFTLKDMDGKPYKRRAAAK